MPIKEPVMPTIEDKKSIQKEEQEEIRKFIEKKGIKEGDYIVHGGLYVLKEINLDELTFKIQDPFEKNLGMVIKVKFDLEELEKGTMRKATKEEVLKEFSSLEEHFERERLLF